MSPDDFNAIDETLYTTRGDISFKMYNKDKPAKYGINVRSLGILRRPYVFYTVPYAGKPEVLTDQHAQDTATLVKRIIVGYLRGTNISMDRYYISIPTAQWLFCKEDHMYRNNPDKSKRYSCWNEVGEANRTVLLDAMQTRWRSGYTELICREDQVDRYEECIVVADNERSTLQDVWRES